MIYLYILFEMSAAGNVLKWRVPQKDMPACMDALKQTKTAFPKTTENELGVVVTCGGENVEYYLNGKWSKP